MAYGFSRAVVLVASLVISTAAVQAQTTLEKIRASGVMTAGTSGAYPPFEYMEDGKLVGFDVDMANEIGKRMGVKVEFQTIDFKGIVAALQSGRVDTLITALTKTPERAERIAFSVPYYNAGIGAIVATGSTIQKPEDLAGKKVGVQLGSSGERFVRDTLGDKIGELKTYDSIVFAINDLKNGRVDAVVNPLPVLGFNIRNQDGFRRTDVWDSRVVGINTRLDDADLLAEINKTIEAMQADGTMDRLATKWFGGK